MSCEKSFSQVAFALVCEITLQKFIRFYIYQKGTLVEKQLREICKVNT